MRPDQGNPLDLNNLPDDYYSRDGKQVLEDTSSGYRKKKSGAKDGKDECGKVYECRFCSLKFCKSQALGGHMNRHRQERETETLNKARQLVFSNDTLPAPGAPHIGCCHPINTPGGYHHPAAAGNIGGHDPTLPLRFPSRVFSGSSSSTLIPPPPPQPAQPQPQPYLYSSPSRPMSYPSQYPPHQHSVNDYYVGHVLGSSGSPYGHLNANYAAESTNYACIGAPVGHHGFGQGSGSSRNSELAGSGGGGGGGGGGRDGSLHNQQEEGLNWSRSYAAGTQQRLDAPPSINRFQHGF